MITVPKSEEPRIFISMQESVQNKTNNLYFWNKKQIYRLVLQVMRDWGILINPMPED